jgi:hypothetical protein
MVFRQGVDVILPLAAAELSLNRELRWAWYAPPWLAALIAAAGVACIAWIYAREAPFVSRRLRAVLALLRLAAFSVLLAMLAQPVIERSRVAPPRLVLLLDQSASMTTSDVTAAKSPGGTDSPSQLPRIDAWKEILGNGEHPLLQELQNRFALKIVLFADETALVNDEFAKSELLSASAKSPDKPSAGTRLGDAIDFATRQLEGPRPAAVVVMTDGISTAGLPLVEAAARARSAGVPVFAVALGSDRPRPDSTIDDIVSEQIVFPGDRLQVEATIRAVGLAGKPGRMVLKNRDSGETLAHTDLPLPADGQSTTARLALRPTTPGPLPLQVLLEPQPEEENTSNNAAELTLDVRQEPIRTLLVDSTPSFEYRALKSLLERDPAIALRIRLQDADPDFPTVDAAAIPEFPANENELFTYDVIILGDVDPQLLPRTAGKNLHDFVSNEAGGLIFIAGPRFMPRALRDVEPIQSLLPATTPANRLRTDEAAPGESFHIEPTPLGMQDPSLLLGDNGEQSATIWRELPPVHWLLMPLEPKLGAQVLATAKQVGASEQSRAEQQGSPAILRHYVGAGEVLMHATDETWRWRWRSDDRFFARYWGQAVRRLARGRAVRGIASLTSNRKQYAPGEPVIMQASLRPNDDAGRDSLTIELEAASQPTRQIKLSPHSGTANLFETTLLDLPPDHYTARLTPATGAKGPLAAEFTVTAPPTEMSNLVVNAAGLNQLADRTGGKFYTFQIIGELLDQLPPAAASVVERLPDEPLWNRPLPLAALCLLLGAEWLIRRRHGML